MVEKVVIEVSGTTDVDKTIDQLEKIGKVDKQNADQFKKSNAEFQKGLKESQTTTEKVTANIKNQFASLGASIAGAFAVQSVINFGKAALNSFMEAERGERLLFNAIGKNQKAFDGLIKQAEKLQNTTVFSDDQIIAAQSFLAAQGRTEAQIKKVIEAAVQLSTVTGQDLQTTITQLDATFEGNIGRLGKLDERFKGLTKTQLENGAAVDLIAEKYKGFAESELETTSGKLARLNNIWDNVKEKIGGAIVSLADYMAQNSLLVQALTATDEQMSDAILKGKIFNGVVADINQSMGDDFQNASQDWANNQAKNYKSTEKVKETVGVLLDQIKQLQEAYKETSTAEEYAVISDKIKVVQEKLKKIVGETTDKIKEQKKELGTRIDDTLGGTLDVKDYEAKQKEIADLAQAGRDKAEEIRKKELEDRLKMDDLIAENAKKNEEEITKNLEEEQQKRKKIQEDIYNTAFQLGNMFLNFEQQREQQATNYKLQLLQTELEAEHITRAEYDAKRKEILKQNAEKQKEMAIFQATINGASAVLKAYSDEGAVGAALAGVLALAELALISATPLPQFEKGGKVKGKRHSEGGTPIEAEEGEFVINRKAAKKIGFDTLEMLNKGVIPPKLLRQGLNDTKNKTFENRLISVLGSSQDFDTYPLERLMKKGLRQEREMTETLVKVIRGNSRKRGGY
jgi:hypothetical protein